MFDPQRPSGQAMVTGVLPFFPTGHAFFFFVARSVSALFFTFLLFLLVDSHRILIHAFLTPFSYALSSFIPRVTSTPPLHLD